MCTASTVASLKKNMQLQNKSVHQTGQQGQQRYQCSPKRSVDKTTGTQEKRLCFDLELMPRLGFHAGPGAMGIGKGFMGLEPSRLNLDRKIWYSLSLGFASTCIFTSSLSSSSPAFFYARKVSTRGTMYAPGSFCFCDAYKHEHV